MLTRSPAETYCLGQGVRDLPHQPRQALSQRRLPRHGGTYGTRDCVTASQRRFTQNLFYGRQLRQIFDLKGSTRNRRAEENNPVLLDENLLEGEYSILARREPELTRGTCCSLAQEPPLRARGVEAIHQAGDLQ